MATGFFSFLALCLFLGAGADAFVMLTDVDGVYNDFNGPSHSRISELGVAEAEGMLSALPAGSMRPKVEAACEFTRATGKMAAIGSLDGLGAILSAADGTRIVA